MAIIVGAALIFLFVLFFVVPWLVASDMSAAKKKRAKAEKDAATILPTIFDGTNVVTYTVLDSGLTYDTVMKAAPNYGYKFLTENQPKYGGPTLVFEKA